MKKNTLWDKKENTIIYNDEVLFVDISDGCSLEQRDENRGVFLEINRDLEKKDELSFWSFYLGNISIKRGVALERVSPWWFNTVFIGDKLVDIPIETSWLILELQNGEHLIIAALPDFKKGMVASLNGVDDGLEIRVDSNDPAVGADSVLGLYMISGNDVYELCNQGVREIQERLGTFRLRDEKQEPEFTDSFGWCTWDAFYQAVSEEKVYEGLDAWKKGGLQPRMLILDDGWLSEKTSVNNGRKLTRFEANEKFPNGLKAFIEECRRQFDLEFLFVWHSLIGYWGGLDSESFKEYTISQKRMSYGRDMKGKNSDCNDWDWTEYAGVVAPRDVHRFMFDFHRFLSEQGVDGVKVDFQAGLEGLSQGLGGRAYTMRMYREALEGSTNMHFKGNLINCMSNVLEMYYSSKSSMVTRTSEDYFPDKPESHGKHIANNAYVGLWFGEIVLPDWDMFHSEHDAGSFHAASRAISGSPVYVSDKPGQNNITLLKKVVLPNGKVLRCKDRARPLGSRIYDDVINTQKPLVLYNRNETNKVVGVFNCCNSEKSITYKVKISEVINTKVDEFAIYSFRDGNVIISSDAYNFEGELSYLEWDVYTFAPMVNKWASLGLKTYINSGGAIKKEFIFKDSVEVYLKYGGQFLAVSKRQPQQILCNDKVIPFRFNNQILECDCPEEADCHLLIRFV
jgi:raffinose synthase